MVFWEYEAEGTLIGVMGFQPVQDVDLIRHAYVLPGCQRRGVGGALLAHAAALEQQAVRQLASRAQPADWAIRFYERHGFSLVSTAGKITLSEDRSDRAESRFFSVVLANPPLEEAS